MAPDELTIAVESKDYPCAARPSMKERQWQLREDAILDAATELLKTKGFNAMTLEDITESIGISRPTLYQHFKSKEDLASRVVIRNLCTVCGILGTLNLSLPAGERLRVFLRRAVAMRFDSTRIAMYDMTRIKFSQSKDCPELRRLELEFAESLAKLIGEAQAEGAVWGRVRPEILVLIVMGFIKNLEIDVQVAEGKTTPAEIEDALEHLVFDRV